MLSDMKKFGLSPAETKRLISEATRTLVNNDRGGYTVPSPRLYPFQWMWDAAFFTLGWRTFDEPRAWQELNSLFKAQWDNGMVPHIVFHRPDPGYFPGPDYWRGRGPVPSSGITQPPILATAIRILLENTTDPDLAQREASQLFPRLLAYHRWLVSARDPNGTGLVAILHPWESGLDNSPTWDEPLKRAARVPLHAARRDTAQVPEEQRPHAWEYEHYLGLVDLFRGLEYDPAAIYEASPFRVVSVAFNAIFHRANEDLAFLARRFSPADEAEIRSWLARSRQAFEGLWDGEAEFYFSRDETTGRFLGDRTFEGFMPLYSGTVDVERAARLAAKAAEWGRALTFLMPSADPGSKEFEPARYWRGPVWLNVNWLLARGFEDYEFTALAERLRKDGLALTAKSGMWENYHPDTAAGLGGDSFAWTAAVVLDWLAGADHAPSVRPPGEAKDA